MGSEEPVRDMWLSLEDLDAFWRRCHLCRARDWLAQHPQTTRQAWRSLDMSTGTAREWLEYGEPETVHSQLSLLMPGLPASLGD